MQENEFERQVKQQIDDVKITPSAAVWEAVDREIRVRRKRRVVILFWFFSIAIGTAFLIFRHSGETVKMGSRNIAPYAQKAASTARQPVSTSQGQLNIEVAPSNTVTSNFAANRAGNRDGQVTKGHQSNKQFAQNSSRKKINAEAILALRSQPRKRQQKEIFKNTQRPVDLTASSNEFQGTEAGTQFHEIVGIHELNGRLLQIGSGKLTPGDPWLSIQVLPQKENATVQLPSNEPHEFKHPIIHQQPTGIEWSVTAGAGFSLFAEHTENANLVYASVPATSLASFINANQFLTPQPERAGHSYFAGLNGKKFIGKKSFVTAGLGYQFLSTRISAGQQVNNPLSNSFVGGVYRFSNFFAVGANTPYNFSNQFHLFSMPLGYGMNLFNKLPISFSVGLSPQLLITSTALHYDKANGVYYSNSSLINKFQLQTFTQLDYHLKLKGHRSVYAGPDFEYGITDMVNRSVNGSNHVLRYGLHAGFSFYKKK